MTRIAWVPSALLALVLASPGFAAPLYQVSAFVQAVSGGVVDTSTPGLSDSNPVSVSELRQIDDATGFGSAAAGPGSLAVFGTSNYTVTDPTNNTSAAGESTAISTIDDLIFSGTGPLFNLFLNLDLSGVMDVSGTPDLGLSTLEISFLLNGQPAPSGFGGFRTVQIPSFFSDSGVLAGVWPSGQAAFNGTITVGPFDNVPTGVPLSLRMSMAIGADVFSFAPSSIGDSASSIGDIGSTLNFTSSGDLFTGPGLTSVDSAQGSIGNNVWTGTPVTAPTVPEPSSMTLLALAAIALLSYGRRRRERA